MYETFSDIVEVTQNNIIEIVDEDIDMVDFVVDCVHEINNENRFLHAFPRDKGRIYEYRYDDHVWYEMKNKDLISLYKKINSQVLTQYTELLLTTIIL